MGLRSSIHVLDLRHAAGHRMRILAARENVRGPIADYDVCWLEQSEKHGARIIARRVVADFPRALGCEGLFVWLLGQVNHQGAALDEEGNPVEMPEPTAEQLMSHADALVAEARECWERAKMIEANKIVVPTAAAAARQMTLPGVVVRSTGAEAHDDAR